MDASDERGAVRVEDVDTIGRAIRQARKAQGLTQQELADVAGVGVRFLSELERGKPTAEIGLVLRVLADAGLTLVLEPSGWRSRADEVAPQAPDRGGEP